MTGSRIVSSIAHRFWPTERYTLPLIVKIAPYTLTHADINSFILVTGDEQEIVLPAVEVGVVFAIYLIEDGGSLFVTPNAADRIIWHDVALDDGISIFAEGEDGDCTVLVGDSEDGWTVTKEYGNWEPGGEGA